MLVPPAGGWGGGRALIANDLVPPSRWLESPETLHTGSVATNRTTLGRWTVRDETTVGLWLPSGALSVPGWADVDVLHINADGSSHTLTVTVSTDAVRLGGDIRICCSILAGQCIADAFDAMLPTFGIVDAAWGAAAIRLAPHDLVPNPVPTSEMMSIAAWLLEESLINASLADAIANPKGATPQQVQGLIRTIGKEYVLHPGLATNPNHGTMYGWQEPDGRVQQSPINGASFAHEATYFDYSQKVTLVKKLAKLDGQPIALADVYQLMPELVMEGRKGAVPIRHPLVPVAA
jgi:hypothetical protein